MSGARAGPVHIVLAVALFMAAPRWARAEPNATGGAAEAPATEAPPAVRIPGLVVVVDARAAQLDPYQVRRAIEDELGVPLLAESDERAAGILTVRGQGPSDLEMTYEGKDGRRHSRTLKLPDDPKKRLETVALVAGNLARDETGELIEELRPPPSSEPPPPPVPPGDEATAAAQSRNAERTREKEPPPEPPPPDEPPDAKPVEETEAAPEPAPELVDTPLNLSLFHPFALHSDSRKRRFAFEFGLAYSRVGAIDGVAVTALVNQIDGELTGVQVGGIGTLVGGNFKGVSVAGVLAHHENGGRGVIAAGVISSSLGAFRGIRVAGVGLWQPEPMSGVEVSGVANLNGALSGASIAGVTNVVRGDLTGGQLAGVVNVAGDVDGLQLAGVVNVAGDVDGFQLGLVNIGGHVNGVQLGLVNVADEVDGASIALAPIVGDGHQRLVFWTAPGHAIANLGAKFENGPIYSLLGIGYDPEPGLSDIGGGSGRYYPTAALGAHADVGPAFFEFDVQYQSVQRIEDGSEQHHAVALRPKLGWQPLSYLGVFVGFAAERRIVREENLSVRGFGGFQVF